MTTDPTATAAGQPDDATRGTAAVWRRVGYPTEGAVVAHGHGADDSNVGHAHIGGDQPHGHRHRKVAPGEFEDEFYAV